jgi:hypothetical protein
MDDLFEIYDIIYHNYPALSDDGPAELISDPII